MKNAGKCHPVFEEIGGGFMITLFKGELASKKEPFSEITTIKVTDGVTDGVIDGVTGRVTDNQKIIIKYISDFPGISTTQLAEKVGITQRKIKENIAKLKAHGILVRIGNSKSGHWQIVNSNE